MTHTASTPQAQVAQVAQARAHLIETHDIFGAVSFQVRDTHVLNTPEHPTAATDGTDLYFNSEYVASLTRPELLFVYAHEIAHNALGHIWRAQDLADHALANQAADYVVNGILIRDHVGAPPAGILQDPQLSFSGLSFEQVYAILARNKREEQQTGQPQAKPGQSNGPQSPLAADCLAPQEPQPATPASHSQQQQQQPPNTAADWQMAVDQATLVGNKWGATPAHTKLAIDQVRKPRQDWRAILASFVEQFANTDVSWAKPNRRFLAAADLYLPGPKSDSMPPILVYVDTSGSVGDRTRSQFAAQVQAIATDCQPERIVVAYADTEVQHTETWEPGSPFKLNPMGGGGTAFGPALAQAPSLCPDAACIIYLTDADGEDNDTLTPPSIPVLWALAPHATRGFPFGTIVRMEED